MKVIFAFVVVAQFICLISAYRHEPKHEGTLEVERSAAKSDTVTVLNSGKNTEEKPLFPGDKYLYPDSEVIYLPAALLAEEEYSELIVRLRRFSTGKVFRFRDFQKEFPELRRTLSRIHNSVDPKMRHRRLDDYYGILQNLMETMKTSVDEMSNWADKFYDGVNLVYEMHELRLLSLSLFGPNGLPDVYMEGFDHKVKSLDLEWFRLKTNYENLLEKTGLHDQFVPILSQTRMTIDLLLRSQSNAHNMAQVMAAGVRPIG